MKKSFFCLILVMLSLSLMANGVLIKNGVTGQYLNLVSCSLQTVINNQVANTTATMRFVNNYYVSTSTVFGFPHPPEASPTSLRWFINNNWHEAEITPGAGGGVVPPGSTVHPSLDNYLGKSFLAFSVSEEVEPYEEMVFEVTYVQLLPYVNGRVDYFFNTAYGFLANPPLDTLSVNIDILGNRSISDIQLPGFNNTQITINDSTATVSLLQLGFSLNQDLNLSYQLAMENLGASCFSTLVDPVDVPDALGDGFLMSIVEPEPSADVIQKYFTFMLDSSIMMDNASMQQAKDAASYMIQNLNDGDYFNIVDFSTVARTFAVNHVPFNAQNRDLALNYIAQLEPTGYCNISGAFDMAIPQFDSAPDEAANIIVFLTIGQPSAGIVNTDELVSHIDDLVTISGSNVNIFCFGVGDNVAFQLLSRISAAHHGIATYVGLNQLLDVLIDFYTKIRNPILLDSVLEIPGQSDNVGEIFPNPLPNLYLGNQMILCGRYHQPSDISLNISGYVLGSQVNYQYQHQLSSVENSDLQFVMKVWAKLKIEHLMAIYYQLNPNSPEAVALHDQIVQISVDYGVLCSFTSFSGGEVEVSEDIVPAVLHPLQIKSCSPNPFRSRIDLRVMLNDAKKGSLSLKIYNLRGQLLKTLSLIADKTGEYVLSWDGCDENGREVASGVYLCKVSIDGYSQTAKVMRIR